METVQLFKLRSLRYREPSRSAQKQFSVTVADFHDFQVRLYFVVFAICTFGTKQIGEEVLKLEFLMR